MARTTLSERWNEQKDRWNASAPGWRAAFLATGCALVFVLVNWRNYINDYTPLALVPVGVLRDGTLNLDSYRAYADGLSPGQKYTFAESGGHLYPMKPIFVSLLALPAYLPPVLAGVPTADVEFWVGWGRLVNAVIAGWAVALCYLLARRWTDEASSLGLALALAFGTAVWTTVGHCLNYHSGAMLCVAGLLCVLDRFPLGPRRALAAGFLMGAAVGMRPTTVVLLFPIGIYLLLLSNVFDTWKSRLAGFAGLIAVPLVNMALNRIQFGGAFATGYSPEEVDRWNTPFWEGFTGILLAPNSGLLPQTPFLLLAFIGTWAAARSGTIPQRGLAVAGGLGFVAYWLLFARWHDWQGGLAFASRMLSEGYPLLVPLLAIGWERVRHNRTARTAVAVAVGWSILYQIVGVATFDAITGDDPQHRPWTLRDHFYAVYWFKFGTAALLVATAKTLAFFLAACTFVAFVLAPFFLGKSSPTRRMQTLSRRDELVSQSFSE